MPDLVALWLKKSDEIQSELLCTYSSSNKSVSSSEDDSELSDVPSFIGVKPAASNIVKVEE